MPAPKAILPFPDIRALLDRALDAENGLRISGLPKKTAFKLRFNIYLVRDRDRRANKKIYEEGHPLHGHSIYDTITILVRPIDEANDKWVVILRKDSGMDLPEPEEF